MRGGITLLTILEITLGVLFALGALARRFEMMRHMQWNVESTVVLLVLLSVLSFCPAFGLWNEKTWAWKGWRGFQYDLLSIH
jgi:hypothetical protein